MSFSKFTLVVSLCYVSYYGLNILLDALRNKSKHLSVANSESHIQYVVEPPQDLTTKKPIEKADSQTQSPEAANHFNQKPQTTEESNDVLHDLGLEIIGDDGMTATPENLLTVAKARR